MRTRGRFDTDVSFCMSLSAYMLDAIVVSTTYPRPEVKRSSCMTCETSARSTQARRLHLGDALKYRSGNAARVALSSVALAALVAATGNAWALGLGRLNVQSALGETLRAEIEISSLTPEEESSLKVRIASPEAYRHAGRRLQRRAAFDAGHGCPPLRWPGLPRVTQRSLRCRSRLST